MYKKGRVNSNSRIISTDEDPSLRIESSAIINLRGVSTKLNKYVIYFIDNTFISHTRIFVIDYILSSTTTKLWTNISLVCGGPKVYRGEGGKCIRPWDSWSQKILGFPENILHL